MPEIPPLVLIATVALVGVVAVGLLARPLIRALLGGETFVEIEGQVQPEADPKAKTQASPKAQPQTRAQAQPKPKAKTRAQDQPGTSAKPGTRPVAPKPGPEEAQPAAAPTPAAAVAPPEAPTTAAAQPLAATTPPPLSTATFAPEQLNPAAALARKKRRPGASLTPFRTMAGALVKKK